MEWARPPPLIMSLGLVEADSEPARAPPPPPDLPVTEVILSQLEALESELQKISDPEFEDFSAAELDENWWRLHSPPLELSLLIGDEPEEIRTEVLSFKDRLRETYYTATEEPAIECGLEVVVEEDACTASTSSHSSSGVDSNGSSSELVGSSMKFRSGSRLSSRADSNLEVISRRTSVATASSSSDASSSLSTRGGILRLAPKQRNVKHAMVMPGILLYSPYYTSSPGVSSALVGPQMVSPKGEAIKKYLKNRKAQSECASCLEDHRNKKLTTLTCQHRYCSTCLRTLINTAVTDEALFPPKCCLNEIPVEIINATLTRSERNVYKAKFAEYQVPYGDRLHCPRPQCSAWIPPSAMENAQYDFRCRKCRHKICRYCKGPTHPVGTECPEDTGIAAVIDIAHKNGWIRCYQCHAVVERSTGCRHMTCRCKAEFCYICGAKWKTCNCNGNEAMRNRPRAVIDDVAAQEQSEVRAAIAAVEAAERREEEERRQAEIAEQIARERREEEERLAREREAANLRAVVDQKLKIIEQNYTCLELTLETLQNEQHIQMKQRHQKEREEGTQRWRDETACLAFDLSTRIVELKGSRKSEVSSLRTTHEEHATTLQTKHEFEEDEHWFSLQRHLRGKPNREARAQTLIDRLKDTQAAEAEEMQKRHASETAGLQRRIAAECLEALKMFTAKRKRIEAEETSKRMDAVLIWKAQERWMEVVSEDRRSHMTAKRVADEEAERSRLAV